MTLEAFLLGVIGIAVVLGLGALVERATRRHPDQHADDWTGEYWGAHRW